FAGILDRAAGEDVGTYAITQGGLIIENDQSADVTGNYEITFVSNDFTITPAPLTVTAEDKSKTYDGAAYSSFTVTYTGFVNAEDETDLGGSLDFSGDAAGAVDVGTYTITPAGLTSDNYAITFVDGTLTITEASLEITAGNQTKIYGESDPELTWEITSGELAPEDELTGSLSRESGEDVGTLEIQQGSLTAGDNYRIDMVDGVLTIVPATLIISANNMERELKEDDPEFTARFTGFQFSDDPSVVRGLSFEREPGDTLGEYVITPYGAEADNYIIEYETGILTIYSGNTPPVLVNVEDGLTEEERPLRLTEEYWTGHDEDGDPLQLLVRTGENYTFEKETVYPDAGFTGILDVPVVLFDGTDTSDSKIIEVTVRHGGSNTAPRLIRMDTLVVEMNRGIYMGASMELADDDGDSVHILSQAGDEYRVAGDTLFPEAGFTGVFTVPFRLTDRIDTTRYDSLTVRVFERIVDIDIGHEDTVNAQQYRVVAGPNPLPPGESSLTIRAERGKADEIYVRIFTSVGDLIYTGRSAAEYDTEVISHEWLLENHDALSANSYLAIVDFYKQGRVIEQRRIMIGIKR
ncbi:MAG: MBG domain-containing protein, partial [Fibrobacterota bacterium]